MMKTATAILALSLVAGAASAQAADFTGFYAGGDVGAGSLQYDVPGSDLSGSDDGLTYGGFGGWRTNLGSKWVVGVEGRYGATDSDISAAGVTLSSGREWSASGLLGYQVGQKWLLFGTLGYANLKTHVSDGLTTTSTKLDGARLSLGMEYAFSDSLSLRASFDGSGFDDETIGGYAFDNVAFGGASIGALFKF